MALAIYLLFLVGFCLLFVGLCDSASRKLSQRIIINLKALIVFLSVTLAIFGPIAYALAGIGEAFENMCGDNIYQTFPSPNGDYVAYVYTRDCGAITTSYEMMPLILLRPRSAPIVYDHEHIAPRTTWLGGEINDHIFRGDFSDLRWLSNNHLLIELSGERFVFGEDSWENVKISYKKPQQKIHQTPLH